MTLKKKEGNDNDKMKYKVLLLGDSMVGKTSFLFRFLDNKFIPGSLTTIGVEHKVKNINYKNKQIHIDFWDTAGQEKFRAITKNYFKGSDGIVLIYDITKRETFKNVSRWVESLKNSISLQQVGMIIAGNKCDLEDEREVNYEEGEEFARIHNLKFYEMSNKENKNIKEVIISLIDAILEVKKDEVDILEKGQILSSKLDRNRDCNC